MFIPISSKDKEIIDSIINEFFSTIGEDWDFYIDYESSYLEGLVNSISGCHLYIGATKMVIVNDNCDFVIKIPFYGQQIYDHDSDEYVYEDFLHANNGYNSWDYCLTETNIYNKAVREGVKEFFPETYEYQEGYNIFPPVYIQKKMVLWEDSGYEYESEQEKYDALVMIEKTFHPIFDFYGESHDCMPPYIFIYKCLNYYGEDETLNLLYFIKHHNDIINDLHYNNIGVKNDGSPIIFDFSGFREKIGNKEFI